MKKTRKRHSMAFKEEAVRLVVEEGHKISETARNLGINANMLSRWKAELDRPAEAREAEARDRQELNRLKKENRRLRMEQEILKKAMAFFARQSDDDTCSYGSK